MAIIIKILSLYSLTTLLSPFILWVESHAKLQEELSLVQWTLSAIVETKKCFLPQKIDRSHHFRTHFILPTCVIEHLNYEHEACINCVFVDWFTTNHYKMPRNKDGGSTLGECPEYIYQLTPSRSGKKGSLTYFSDSFYKIFPSIDKLSF